MSKDTLYMQIKKIIKDNDNYYSVDDKCIDIQNIINGYKNSWEHHYNLSQKLQSKLDRIKELSHLGYYATKIRYATSFFEDINKIIEEESK